MTVWANHRSIHVFLDGELLRTRPSQFTPTSHLAGQQVILRLDGQLMHVIADGKVVKTLPAPVPLERRAQISGARAPRTPSSHLQPRLYEPTAEYQWTAW
ncbi:hypothetical protein AB0D66_32675 [Streptomyces sp. NPDC048270]|uniref:hypothetical protein n=1 Tax=Streptomyces sp. NPDC048270 TaxID=3154615 RepID=UPI003408C0E4